MFSLPYPGRLSLFPVLQRFRPNICISVYQYIYICGCISIRHGSVHHKIRKGRKNPIRTSISIIMQNQIHLPWIYILWADSGRLRPKTRMNLSPEIVLLFRALTLPHISRYGYTWLRCPSRYYHYSSVDCTTAIVYYLIYTAGYPWGVKYEVDMSRTAPFFICILITKIWHYGDQEVCVGDPCAKGWI